MKYQVLNQIFHKPSSINQMEYVIVDEQFRIIEISDRARHFADRPDEVILGNDVRAGFPELIGVEDFLLTILQGQEEFFEVKGINRSSEENDLYIDVYVIGDEDQKLFNNQLIILLEDSTERMVLKQTLVQRENEAYLLLSQLSAAKSYLEKILLATADALFVVNKNALIKKVNQATVALFGYEENELIGRSISMILAEQQSEFEAISAQEFFQPTTTLSQGEFLQNVEVICQTKAGEEIFIAFSGSAIQPGLDNLEDFVYVGRDITERKRTEAAVAKMNAALAHKVNERTVELRETIQQLETQIAERQHIETALRESKLRFSSLMNSLQDVVWSISATTFELLYLNPATETLYNRPVGEFYNNRQLWLEVVHPEDRERASTYVPTILKAGSAEIEYRIIRGDLEVRWVYDRGQLIKDSKGNGIRIEGIITDITERKQAEAILQQTNEELERRVEERTAALKAANEQLLSEIQARQKTEEALRQAHDELEIRVQERTAELAAANAALQAEIIERQRAEETLQNIVAGTASVTGEEFFPALVRHLAAALSVRYAIVSEIKGNPPEEKLQSLAFWASDQLGDNFEYNLAGTPCEVVIKQEQLCHFPDHVQQRFPQASALASIGAIGYLGVPLLGRSQKVIGNLCIIHDQPLKQDPQAALLITVFAARAAAELERQQAQEALRKSHAELEIRVQERTAELIETNEFLQYEITERKQAEAELQRYADELQDLYNYAPCGYHSLDADGVFLRINDTELNWFGYTRDELIGKMKFSDILTPESVQTLEDNFPCYMEQGWITDLEFDIIRKDGTILPILLSSTAVSDSADNYLMCRSSVFDITARKQAEQALRDSEIRLRRQQAGLMALAKCQPLYTGDLEAALQEITHIAAQTLDLERVSVWFYNDDQSKIKCADLYQLTQNQHSNGLELAATDFPNYFQAIKADRMITADDAHTDPRTQEFSECYLKPLGIASMLDVPIRVGGRTVGVICHEHVGSARRWALEEQNFANYLAYMASLAMEAGDRKRAEEERQKFVALVENSSDFIGMATLNGKVFYVNEAGRQLVGINSPEEVLAANISDYLSPDTWVQYQETLFPTILKNGHWEGEGQLRHFKTGRLIDTQMTMFVVKHPESGKPICFATVQRDITDRKLAEAALLESENKYRSVVNNLHEVIFQKDVNGFWTFLNPAWTEITGFTVEETIGKNFLEFIHPDDRSQNIVHFDSLINHQKEVVRHEIRYLTKNGDYRWIEVQKRLNWASDGTMLGISGTLNDITDRKRIEQALEQERQQLRQIITNAPVAMAMFDTEMRYLAHSNQWVSDYRLEGQSLIGRSHYDVLPDLSLPGKEIHQRALQGQVISKPEEMFERLDGSKMYLRWAVQPWYSSPENVGGIVIVTQVINELVEAREAALEASRMKSQFLANMSHEIRTPMNGVLGMTDLLLSTPLNAEQQDFVRTLRVSGQNLLTLINDILDFSKLEAGEMRLETLDFDLNTCVEEVTDLLVAQANAKGLDLFTLVESNVPVALSGDANRLRQVLLNLAGNAIKFTSQGEVVIHVQTCEEIGESEENLTHSPATVRLRFMVRDTGIGIASANLDKLFLSFSQVDASTTRQYGGTGLGLVICKQLVELMGGEIGVESVEGQGSTFWFTATFQKQSINNISQPLQHPEIRIQNRRMLIVDDSLTNRQILRSYANSFGIEVSETKTGTTALTILRQAATTGQPYDVALISLDILGMSGEVFGQLIRFDPALAQTKWILIASMHQRDQAIRLLDLGFSCYLIKPVKASKLLSCLMQLMNSNVYPSAEAALAAGWCLPECVPPLLAKQPSVQDNPQLASKSTDASVQQPVPSNHAPDLKQPETQAQPPATLKILLVEDTPINQKVALTQLKVLGYQADCVSDGQQALDRLAETDYDIVLMDCLMPVLDGYKTTQALRLREGESRHTIVIALTANALKGDREKCLAAGMDDYISKPIDLNTLEAILNRYKSLKEQHEAEIQAPALSTVHPVSATLSEVPVDLERLHELSRGDAAFELELLETFMEDAPTYLEEIKQAAETSDLAILCRRAHQLKGASGMVAIRKMPTLAAQLESQAQENHLEGSAELITQMEVILEQVKALIANWPAH